LGVVVATSLYCGVKAGIQVRPGGGCLAHWGTCVTHCQVRCCRCC
jgi:hypothetical protein